MDQDLNLTYNYYLSWRSNPNNERVQYKKVYVVVLLPLWSS